MKKQNSKLPYLLALSYTQNVHNIEYATKLFKNNFPLGKIEQVKIDDFDEPEKAIALALLFELSVNEIEDISNERDNYWSVQGIEYLFGTDEEMDNEWDEHLDNYIEECVLPEIPEYLQSYFDEERFKDDCRIDGRGHSLNSYDGKEEEIEYNDTKYFAYRQ